MISYLLVYACMSILPPCSIVTLLRYVSIELKELITYLHQQFVEARSRVF